MKEKILELRNQGMSYREIQKVLGCSRSLVSYYVNPDGKQKHRDRQNQNRYRKRTEYKTMLGGKCSHCGYNKCQDALQFHHIDPSTKKFTISDSIWGKGGVTEEEIFEEIKKCDLLCANCHCESHSHHNF